MKRIIILILALTVVAAGVLTAWAYSDLHKAISHQKTGQYIEIPKGSSPSAVVKKLASEGIIRHEWPLMLYIKSTGASSTLKAGEYDFPSPISPLNALGRIQRGQRRLNRFTVIEGWTRWDIAKAMIKIPEFRLTDETEALKLMDDVSLIRDLDPKAGNLEGYLYPDTYEFSPETSASDLIEIMIKRFRAVWKPEWSDKAQSLNLSPREVLTVASLIETEAKLADERPLVASVIYNRLQRSIPLAVDSSIIYASKLEGKWKNDGKVYKSDVERRSPYNTRLHTGLPPGPISSPGKSSLEAALSPTQTDYLYYVREPSRNDGAHNFYNNEHDFGVGVQALRNWEAQRDAAAGK